MSKFLEEAETYRLECEDELRRLFADHPDRLAYSLELLRQKHTANRKRITKKRKHLRIVE